MKLSNNFHIEERELNLLGIVSWESIKNLKDSQITNLASCTLCTERNLKKIRCIATLISEINLSQKESALLMHSGISSIKSLSNLTPQELITKTGRLERSLNLEQSPIIDLKKASLIIKKAKARAKY